MAIWAMVGIWVLGSLLDRSARERLLLIGLVWLAAITAAAFAPMSWTAEFLGGSARGWGVFAGVVVLVWAYRWLLGILSRRSRPIQQPVTAPPATLDGPLTDDELDRYARHIVLREIGGTGQRALRRAHVVIIGAGGLGSPAALYLAAAGVGHLTLVDDDAVSLSNLQRQIMFDTKDIGRPKVEAGAERLGALNPAIRVDAWNRRLGAADARLFDGVDLVLDGTDSFAGRQQINEAAVAAGVPLLSGSLSDWDGQVTLYDPKSGAPCLACIFPEAPADGLAPGCAATGVIGALPGVIGSLMAMEAIKTLTGAGRDLRGRMLMYDALGAETRVIKIARRPDCPVCGGHD